MKRSLAISDWFYRLSHTVKRNRFAVVVYILLCLLFLVVGIAVGANMGDKTAYVLRNKSVVFGYLRGDSGIVAFFFTDVAVSCIYCVFSASMFFFKVLTYVSVAPCMYRSYVLGLNVCIIISVYSVSSLPMLFVAFVPICIAEIIVLCIISFGCFRFASLNRCGMPSKPDIKLYYKGLLAYIFAIAVMTLVKAVLLALFGSALVGVV